MRPLGLSILSILIIIGGIFGLLTTLGIGVMGAGVAAVGEIRTAGAMLGFFRHFRGVALRIAHHLRSRALADEALGLVAG